MTFETFISEQLEAHGLWPDEATDVVTIAKAHNHLDAMSGRWKDDMAGYPPAIGSTLWVSVKLIALKYLRETKPQHFAIGMLQ